jgi:hypothetical protein
MKECKMHNRKWTLSHHRYLAVMDALKAVVGCKQN